MHSRKQRVAGLLVLGSCMILLYAWLLAPLWRGEYYSHLDIYSQFVPWRAFQAAALDRGEMGWWNPFLSRGYPHHGEGQSGLLHPFHLIAYKLLPVSAAVWLELALYIPFACLGMYLFLRRSWRFCRPAALFGAGAFAFSVYLPMHYMHVNLVWVFAHLPWFLLCIERTVRSERRTVWGIGTGAVTASMILFGHPQSVWLNLLAAGVLLAFLIAGERRLKTFRRPGLLLMLIAGALIGMLQILPTADYLRRSTRAAQAWEDSLIYSQSPANLAANLHPQLYRQGFVPGRYSDPEQEGADWSFEYPAYLGFVTLFFIVGTLIIHRRQVFRTANRGRILVLTAAILAVLLLSLGPQGLLIHVLRVIPVISKFRVPARYLCLAWAFTAVLAAYCMDRWCQPETVPDEAKHRTLLLLALAMLPTLAVVVWGITKKSLQVTEAVRLDFHSPLHLLIGLVFLAGLFAVLLVLQQTRKRGILLCVLAVVALVDPVLYAGGLLQQVRAAGKMIQVSDVASVQRAMGTQDHQFRHVAGVNTPVWDGHYLANGYLGLNPPRLLRVHGKDAVPAHIYLASVRVGHFSRPRTGDYERVFRQPLPRARLVPNLRHSQAPLSAVDGFDPQFRQQLETTAHCTSTVHAELSGPPLDPEEQVRIVEDGFSRLRLEIHVTHPRLLVLSDRYWPHWTASIDGRPREILPLYEGALRGLVVQPGEKDILMNYSSPALSLGCVSALLGLLLLLAPTAVNYVRSRRRDTRQKIGNTKAEKTQKGRS